MKRSNCAETLASIELKVSRLVESYVDLCLRYDMLKCLVQQEYADVSKTLDKISASTEKILCLLADKDQ